MFIDYVALMLVNLVIGLVVLAVYVVFFMEKDEKRVAPGLLLSGAIASVTGLDMIFSWPLPSSYNIAYGELSVLFGAVFFFAGLALLNGWDLLAIGIAGVLASFAALIVGLRIMNLNMTTEPIISGFGFLLTGIGGILTLPSYFMRKSMPLRAVTAIFLLLGAAVWAFLGFSEYWTHLDAFAKWAPATMHPAPAGGP